MSFPNKNEQLRISAHSISRADYLFKIQRYQGNSPVLMMSQRNEPACDIFVLRTIINPYIYLNR